MSNYYFDIAIFATNFSLTYYSRFFCSYKIANIFFFFFCEKYMIKNSIDKRRDTQFKVVTNWIWILWGIFCLLFLKGATFMNNSVFWLKAIQHFQTHPKIQKHSKHKEKEIVNWKNLAIYRKRITTMFDKDIFLFFYWNLNMYLMYCSTDLWE